MATATIMAVPEEIFKPETFNAQKENVRDALDNMLAPSFREETNGLNLHLIASSAERIAAQGGTLDEVANLNTLNRLREEAATNHDTLAIAQSTAERVGDRGFERKY